MNIEVFEIWQTFGRLEMDTGEILRKPGIEESRNSDDKNAVLGFLHSWLPYFSEPMKFPRLDGYSNLRF